MPWIQIVNNAAVPFVFLLLTVIALAGQVLSLRVISLSLFCALLGGAYGADEALTFCNSHSLGIALSSGLLIGALIGAIGAIVDAIFSRQSKALALLASLGLLEITQGVVTLLTGGGVEVLPVHVPRILPTGTVFSSPSWLLYGFVLGIGAAIVYGWILNSTSIGLAAIAIGDNPNLAALFAIPARRTQVLIQALGGGIAGTVGVLMAVDSGLRTNLGFDTVLKAFGILIIARGRYALMFPWVCGLVVLEQVVGYEWGGEMQEAAGLAFLALVLILTKSASWGTWLKKNSRSAGARA